MFQELGLLRHNTIRKWKGNVTLGYGDIPYDANSESTFEYISENATFDSRTHKIVESTFKKVAIQIRDSEVLELEYIPPGDRRDYTSFLGRYV